MKKLFCTSCYQNIEKNTPVCPHCGNIVVEFSLEEKEARMKAFADWLTNAYRVQSSREKIKIQEIHVKKWILSFDFGRDRVGIFGGILLLISPISLFAFFARNIWKARFNELGIIYDLRNSRWQFQEAVLDAYVRKSDLHTAFFSVHPESYTKRNFWNSQSIFIRLILLLIGFWIVMSVLTALIALARFWVWI